MMVVLVNKIGGGTVTRVKASSKSFRIMDVDVADSILIVKDFISNCAAKAEDD